MDKYFRQRCRVFRASETLAIDTAASAGKSTLRPLTHAPEIGAIGLKFRRQFFVPTFDF